MGHPVSTKEAQPRVQWQQVKWPDSSSYEGLVKDDCCHVRGIFKYSNGDRYEGEFADNNMEGYGVYVWGAEGSVYRGQWLNSVMHGCGVKITRQPTGGYLAEEGRFENDEWVGEVKGCSIAEARAAAAQADTAARMARVFEDGSNLNAASARAQETAAAAAAVAATARPARLRRHQRQYYWQKQQRQQQELNATLEELPPPPRQVASVDLHPSAPAAPHTYSNEGPQLSLLLQQAQKKAQSTLGSGFAAVQHVAQRASNAFQQLLHAGQGASTIAPPAAPVKS